MRLSALFLIVCGIFIDPAHAQPWTRQLLAAKQPVAMTFKDSVRGFAVVDQSKKISLHTFDGGKSWEEGVASSRFTLMNHKQFEFVEPGYIFSNGIALLRVRDFGQSLDEIPKPQGVPALRMLSPRYGMALFAGGGTSELSIRESIDSGYSWIDRVGIESPLGRFLAAAIILDSFRIYCTGYADSTRYIISSIDRGQTWKIVYPLDTSKGPQMRFGHLVEGASPERVFAIGGQRERTDAVYTTDDGTTWNTIEYFGGRIFRLEEPSPNFLVAAIGNKFNLGASLVDLMAELYAPPEYRRFSDTIAFSRDGGKTWTVDGETFKGDTIVAISFPDTNHGFVLSYSNGNSYLSKYSSGPKSKVDHESRIEANKMKVYPNPATSRLQFVPIRSGQLTVEVIDMLGIYRVRESRDLRKGVGEELLLPASLPTGCYVLSLTGVGFRDLQWFIKQ